VAQAQPFRPDPRFYAREPYRAPAVVAMPMRLVPPPLILLLLLSAPASVSGICRGVLGGRSIKGANSSVDLVFWAGVEGAGHHFMHAVMQHVPSTLAKVASQWRCGVDWERSHYPETVNRFRELSPDNLNVLDSGSYPMCCTGNHEDRMYRCHPHLDWLAEAAREAGADLKVLLLYRRLEDCLAADCLHRNMETCTSQTETLISNAKIMASHLRGLAPDQISCLRFGDPESMNAGIRDAFSGHVPESLVDDEWESITHEHRRESYEGWDGLAAQLQEADSALEQLCSESQQLTLKDVMAMHRGCSARR